VTLDPQPGQGGEQEPEKSGDTSPQREGAVIHRLLSGTSGESVTVIPGPVYDMINEIVNFTYELEGRSNNQP
jgi:hypothetical protein